jgi:hypothetical protein
MRFKYVGIALLLALSSSLSFAQGSGSTEGTAPNSDFKVTRSSEGKIAQVKPEDKLLVVEEKNGEHQSFHLTDQTKIASAKNKSDTSLKVSALKPGERVKVIFRPSDSSAVQVSILE